MPRPLLHPQTRRHNTTSSSTSLSQPHIPGRTIILPSGRSLGYHTNGPEAGTPIIYIHGHPDSGLTITGQLESRVAKDLNVRWIGPDRPGVGLSTKYESQKVLDYPSDIQALAQHLDLKEFYIIGTSGGTGYTLACAKELARSQLKGVGICAGVGPVECGFDSMDEHQLKAMEAWRDYPKEFREYYETEYVSLAQQADITALAKRLRGEIEEGFHGADRELLLQENNFEMAVKVFRQAWIQGAWAHAKGMELHWNPWGFALEELAFPGIKLWYGSKDVSTTPTMGRYMADKLEESVYKEYTGLSHFTIWQEGCLQEMVRDLLGRR
jgi:pimeloyl-ACP methyl ester carboxylesterase